MELVKEVIKIGNGAAVYVPKEYLGDKIKILLPEKVEKIKHRILMELINFMPGILGIYLYGSYVREEYSGNSDIDVLVITNKKYKKIKIGLENVDLRVISIEDITRAIKRNPVLIMPILREAEVLINPLLLEELKKYKIEFRKFKWHFDEIKSIIKVIERFIELDDKDISSSHIYSLVMRIRVCFMVETLLKNTEFSNKAVKELLLKNGFNERDVDKFFNIYKLVRDDKKIVESKIEKKEILKLIDFLKNYLKKLENETQKKIRQRD